MKTIIKKYRAVLLIIVLIAVRYGFGFNVAMLVFILFWQVLAILAIINGIKFLIKTQRKQLAVKGHVIEVNEVPDPIDNDTTYEVVIEFSYPTGSTNYQLKHSTTYKPYKKYTVWVNKQNPQKSTVDDQLQGHIINIVPLILIVLALFYVDYIYIKKILMGD